MQTLLLTLLTCAYYYRLHSSVRGHHGVPGGEVPRGVADAQGPGRKSKGVVHKSLGQRPKEVDLAFYVLLDSRVPFFFT